MAEKNEPEYFKARPLFAVHGQGSHDTQHNDIQHNGDSYGTQHNSIECHYAECRDYLNVKLSVVRLNGVRLSVIAPGQELTYRA
jgi:hypothetical protein